MRFWISNPLPSTQSIKGIGIGRKLALEMSHVHFHVFSERVCALHATIFNVKFQFFSVYFPTSWEHDEVVEQVYDLLTVLISACVRDGATPLVAGDFNASIGRALPHDEIEFFGFCGCGRRNARGWATPQWVEPPERNNLLPSVVVHDSESSPRQVSQLHNIIYQSHMYQSQQENHRTGKGPEYFAHFLQSHAAQ